MLPYTIVVAFSVIYTGDHWLIDAVAGVAYAYVAYYAVVHLPARLPAVGRALALSPRRPSTSP